MRERTITFRIFRHDPYAPASRPHLQEYLLEETPRMTLFTALNRIREEQDPSLRFDFVCRSAVCGSCAMLVNGRPRLACRTRTEELPKKITLFPLPFFRLVGDLLVDTGTWFRQMRQQVESWIHTHQPFDPQAEEERMSNEEALAVYELDRCIECGCCLASCAAAQMRPDFLGGAGMLTIARFLADPRDQRSDAEMYRLIGTEEGVFGCVGLLACQDYCPKGLPLQTQIAYLRRKMLLAGLRGGGNGRAEEAPAKGGEKARVPIR